MTKQISPFNATGATFLTGSLGGKRLGLLHELVPGAEVVPLLVNPNRSVGEEQIRDVTEAAHALGQKLLVLDGGSDDKIEAGSAALAPPRVSGLLVGADPFFGTRRGRLIALALQHRMPAIYQFREYAGRKGGTYLICDNASRHRACPSVRWRYRDFEATFLAFVEELDIESIINEGSQAQKRRELDDELSALRGELSSVTDMMERAFEVLSQGGPVEFVTTKLNELDQRRSGLDAKITTAIAGRDELLSSQARYQRSKDEIRQLVDRLQSPGNEELFKLRAQIASQLKSLIHTLLVGSLGEEPRMRTAAKTLREVAGTEAEDVIAYMEGLASAPNQRRRFFAVGFRGSNVRIVFPNADDPLRYEQQITANRVEGIQRFE
jgi:hypothetical protein